MKKCIAVLLTLVLCVSAFTVSAGAVLPPVDFGDVDDDGYVEINDVTLIQRGLAKIMDLGYEGELRADFDRDGEMSSLDATWIQRKLAGMSIPENCGGWGWQDITVTSFYADYESGKAAVGVPVTFTAQANCGEEDCTYEFSVDGQIVRERSQQNTFTYTFAQSGYYDISVTAYNPYGFRETISLNDFIHYYDSYYDSVKSGYEIVDSYSYDEPELVSVSWIDLLYSVEPGLEVHAAGGTAPYTYSFTIPRLYDGNNGWYGNDIQCYNDFMKSEGDYGWKLLYNEDNKPYLYHDFSAENTVKIPLDMFTSRVSHSIIVQAKDADGNLTETRTLYFNDVILIG